MRKTKILAAFLAALMLCLAGCKKSNAANNMNNVPSAENSTAETTSESDPPAEDIIAEKEKAEGTVTSDTDIKAETEKPTESTIKPTEPPKADKTANTAPKNPKSRQGNEKNENEKSSAPSEQESKPQETQKTPDVSQTEDSEFNIARYIEFAREYAQKSGLRLNPEAIYCWDNPIAAGEKCRYTERDIKAYIDRYAKAPEITEVWIWSEEDGKNHEIYIGYA